MIEINLARQIQGSPKLREPSGLGYWLMTVFVVIGVGVGSWWWTQSLQQQVDSLLHEKMVKSQSLVRLKNKLENMEGYAEEKKVLLTSVERLSGQEKEKAWPVILLNGISQSINELDIWLERIQIEAQIVELKGKSLGLEDIGEFIEALEHARVIMSFPVVETLDPPEANSEIFSFMIRFVFDPKVTM
jgi:hypothetical protein